jgi:hypothetical protein
LDEDPPIQGQEYALVSYIAPEYVENAKAYYVKVSGVYKSLLEADKAGKKLDSIDSRFRRFAVPVGKWTLFLPSHKYYASGKNNAVFTPEEQNNAFKVLNELAGRYKKRLEQNAKKHEKRVENDMVEMARQHKINETNNKSETENEKDATNDTKLQEIKSVVKDDVMNRLDKKIEEIKQTKEQQEQKPQKINKFENLNRDRSTLMNNLHKKLEDKKQQIKQQNARYAQQTTSLSASENNDKNIVAQFEKMKEQYNELKK